MPEYFGGDVDVQCLIPASIVDGLGDGSYYGLSAWACDDFRTLLLTPVLLPLTRKTVLPRSSKNRTAPLGIRTSPTPPARRTPVLISLVWSSCCCYTSTTPINLDLNKLAFHY